MALTTGAGPHTAFLTVNGGTFPIEHGAVEQRATKQSSTFSAVIPMYYPGAAATLATLGDNTASISTTTRGITANLITGEVDDTSFDYIAGNIHVSGRDLAAKLHENKSSQKWMNQTPSQIVQQLAGQVGIGVSASAISGLMAGKKLVQDYVKISDNVSFAYVIHKLAEFDGAKWWVDANGMFNYAAAGSSQGIYTLNYNDASNYITADFLRLTVRRNVQAGKSIAVTVKSWHPKAKQVNSYTSNVEGNGGPINYNYHLPNLLQDHVQQHAKSRANEAARHELKLTATIAGDPTVNVAMGLQLTGTGFWDQMYEMDCVQHHLGMSGHRTTIVARSAMGGRQAS